MLVCVGTEKCVCCRYWEVWLYCLNRYELLNVGGMLVCGGHREVCVCVVQILGGVAVLPEQV